MVKKRKLDDEEKQNISIKHNLKKHMDQLDITDKMLARELGINWETFIRKRLNPDGFKLSEFRYVINRLELSESEIMEGLRQ